MRNAKLTALLMIVVQILLASVNVLYKVAINDGIDVKILTSYRLMFAAASTIPMAIFLERKERPKLTWRVVWLSFFSGLFGGSLFQNLYFESLALVSATFVSAIFNLTPGITFILAVSFGMEKLNFHTVAGKAKVLGTITGIGGAMLLTFLKGVELNIWSFHFSLLHKGESGTIAAHHGSKMLGILFGLGSSLSFALWLIIQAKISNEYKGYYSSTALMSLMGAIQATGFALCVTSDWSQWRLGWSIRLLTASYSGIVTSGLMVIIIAWCVKIRGPLYTSTFNPLLLVLVAVAGSVMLDEKLYLGSVIGAILIMVGLYLVLWGKSKEKEEGTHSATEVEAVGTSTIPVQNMH